MCRRPLIGRSHLQPLAVLFLQSFFCFDHCLEKRSERRAATRVQNDAFTLNTYVFDHYYSYTTLLKRIPPLTLPNLRPLWSTDCTLDGRETVWPLTPCYSNTFEVAWQSAQWWIGVLTTLDISENTDKAHSRFIDWPKRGGNGLHTGLITCHTRAIR